MPDLLPAAGYIRVSTRRQAEAAQRAAVYDRVRAGLGGPKGPVKKRKTWGRGYKRFRKR